MGALVEAKRTENKGFFPTPEALITRMRMKIKGHPDRILDPSAGKGDLLTGLSKTKYIDHESGKEDHHSRDYWIQDFSRSAMYAIEIDEDFQHILVANRFKLLDSDFLTFCGPDQFDLIIANPPFDQGDLHLLKAIDMMYCGQIIFLLNAETLRNPYTNTRKELAKRLRDLNAEVEYISGAFIDAERPTGVEIAIVNIVIERKIEDDLFDKADDKAETIEVKDDENFEVSTGKNIEELVLEYNQIVEIGKETIVAYFKNYPKIWKYIGLNAEIEKYKSSHDNMTKRMNAELTGLLKGVRTDFWRRTLDIPQVTKRMTADRRKDFEDQLTRRCDMDFTESNIRQFIINLIDTYEEHLFRAVVKLFDKMTIAHSFSDDNLYNENIHYYNGWKTNKAFQVNKKVILPIYGHYSRSAFVDDYSGKWKLNYQSGEDLFTDLDVVMNYFDSLNEYQSCRSALDYYLDKQINRNIESTYFTMTVYKKGTIHLTFNDDGVWRRFNVAASLGKNWLPQDYGKKAYRDMNAEEQAVVKAFEGPVSYEQNRQIPLFHSHVRLSLTM